MYIIIHIFSSASDVCDALSMLMIFSMSFRLLKLAVAVYATLVTSISYFANACEVSVLESVNLRAFMLNTK